MATKRLRDTRNYSENIRNSILDRRVISLFKKAEELSIMCDIEVTIIILRPGSIQPITWKSASLAQGVLTRYLSCEANERIKNFVKHETYLQCKAEKKEKQISKLEKMNEEKEMELLFNQLVEGKSINELDARQMKGDGSIIESAPTKANDTNVGDNGHSKDLD
ncbi:hypothetical protein MTR67_052247 [Solanum verrucosum]|uniref:MADS-box domain-containing protein n=1 Tax=Solanum verrucosum TaxID=315347 RepID=A0AAF0ZZS6_SOLVR|nr:hypothetical protein MTR67_052247 [Solanum verrucosum]